MSRKPLPFDPVEEASRHWTERWDGDSVPAMEAVTSIMRAQQLLLGELNAHLSPFGLTFARYEALLLLLFSSKGELPLVKFGERLQVHPTSVTNLIDRLEKDGLVERVPHATDRRAMLARLTPSGRALAEKATTGLNETRFGLEGMSDAELKQLVRVIRKMRLLAGDFEVDRRR